MFARFKREWLKQGGRCAGALLLLSATAVAPALAQNQKAYRPQIAAMMAEARTRVFHPNRRKVGLRDLRANENSSFGLILLGQSPGRAPHSARTVRLRSE